MFPAIVRYLGDPAASVVDKFFPSAFSPHSLLSTNAVVGRSYTGSIISFHNSPRSFPASHIPQSRFSIPYIRLSHREFQSPLQSALSHLDFQVWSYSENWRRRQVTLHLAGETSHFRVQAFGF